LLWFSDVSSSMSLQVLAGYSVAVLVLSPLACSYTEALFFQRQYDVTVLVGRLYGLVVLLRACVLYETTEFEQYISLTLILDFCPSDYHCCGDLFISTSLDS